jgi:hypothetical protein
VIGRAHIHVRPWVSPEQADAYAETARLLGYEDGPTGVERCNLEHDLLHTYVSVVLLHRPESPMLRSAATGALVHPTRHHDAAGFEERLIQALQVSLNGGPETEPLSLLWWMGYEPDALKDELRGWLDGAGWTPC